MCKAFNSIGSLTVVKSHLIRHNINEFNSLNEVIAFQKNYFSIQQEIISEQKAVIESEKEILASEILQLDNAITTRKNEFEVELRLEIDKLKQKLHYLSSASATNIKAFINYFRKISIRNKIYTNEQYFNSKVAYSVRELTQSFTEKNNRHKYITNHFMDAVNEGCLTPLKDLERKKRVIGEINTSIYGALGEQKVVKELEKLSDEYFLINDFQFTFNRPIYNRRDGGYVKSIQIDHVLVSPSGIFIIETKNWSEKSLNNANLRSPVEQIQKFNFALFILLNDRVSRGNVNLRRHHWGERKVPIRNLIVLTNEKKPIEEFQYVKVLTLSELLRYLKYFPRTFSNEETRDIADYLLGCCGSQLGWTSPY